MFVRVEKLTVWKRVESISLWVIPESSAFNTVRFLHMEISMSFELIHLEFVKILTGSKAYNIPRGTSRSATSSRRRPTKYANRTRAIER